MNSQLGIDIYDVNKLIVVNNLQEVTNPVALDIGNSVTSDGLFSNQIFGRTKDERSTIFAYVNLHALFLQPLVYITLRRLMSARIDSLILREIYFKLDPKGYLVEVPEDEGETGIEFLYKNWDKLRFEENASRDRSERIKFLKSLDKGTAFMDKVIVIPPFYRDIRFAGDKVVSSDKVNDYYSNLMRMSRVMVREKDAGGLMIVGSLTRMRMQMMLVEIYNYFKNPPNLSKKYGIIRSGVMGKSIDYSARLVISAPLYDQDRWDQVPVRFDRCGVPLGALVTIFYPFFQHWLMAYFTKEFVSRANAYPTTIKGEAASVELDNPETFFSPEYIDKELKSFVNSYGDRFRKIKVPTKNNGMINVRISLKHSGVNTDDKEARKTYSQLGDRHLTWTDLLYMAAVDITKDKTVIVTRYPLEDYFGTSGFKVHVLSTNTTMPMIINGKFYEHYPIINTDMNQQEVSIQFINTLIMANCFLPGYGADYDGDQITVKGNFTIEANKEIEEIAMSKKNFLTIGGSSNRETMNEALQAIYSLTVD
ncbi:MAG: hypothetical protein ACRCXX_05770 [Cetobacterium sp.]|uniref:hypothetical protein n=1 Tax=Cetobacterium sp. TaxID=2071632 RepID=UPI003F2E55C8